MSFRAKKIDINQPEIVSQLRQMGVSVAITSSLGNGYPDLCLGWKGKNYLIELKYGKFNSQKRLTKLEDIFHSEWKGQVAICETLDDILKIINV